MTDTTYDESRRCRRCGEPGVDVSQRPGPHGTRFHVFRCINTRCRWYNTEYLTQINADGSVVPPSVNREKSFPKIPDRTDAIQASMQRLYEQSLTGGETQGGI